MERTRTTRALAESALVDLVRTLGEHAGDIVVIGGLNPDHLVAGVEVSATHQGTTDIDVLVQVGFKYDRDEMDLSWLEKGLKEAGFVPISEVAMWRWWTQVDGVPVKLELVCDDESDRGQEIVLPGCSVATAMNLEGPGSAFRGSVLREVAAGEGQAPVTVRFAGLGGYLLTKAAAALGRHEDKDVYDFAFVLLNNNEGGPVSAARHIVDALQPASHRGAAATVAAVLRRLGDPQGPDAGIYADQMKFAGSPEEIGLLRQDAVSAATGALKEFQRQYAQRFAAEVARADEQRPQA